MTLRRRLDRAAPTKGKRAVKEWHVWRQEATGGDLFSCDRAPGEFLTADELEGRIDPPHVGRIIVTYISEAPKW